MRKATLLRFVAALAALALMTPGLAPAALSLGGQNVFDPATRTGYVDLVFNETGAPDNEGLFAYDIAASLRRPNGVTGGVNLTGIERPPENFVLDVPSGSTFSVAESTANNVLANVSSNNDLADIITGKKAARIRYTVAPNTPFGFYTLVLDPNNTVFGSGDPNRELQIIVDLRDTDILIPEPSGLALLGAAGLLALRRRRVR